MVSSRYASATRRSSRHIQDVGRARRFIAVEAPLAAVAALESTLTLNLDRRPTMAFEDTAMKRTPQPAHALEPTPTRAATQPSGGRGAVENDDDTTATPPTFREKKDIYLGRGPFLIAGRERPDCGVRASSRLIGELPRWDVGWR